jgi:hypothetical protein
LPEAARWTGVDVFVDITSTQTDVEEEAMLRGGSKVKEKGTKRAQLDLEGTEADEGGDDAGEGDGDALDAELAKEGDGA